MDAILAAVLGGTKRNGTERTEGWVWNTGTNMRQKPGLKERRRNGIAKVRTKKAN